MNVEVINLKKYFKKTKAVDDICFSFSTGQICGFIGPNGAGKTTTMRIMATLDEPIDGDIYIDGVSVVQQPEKARSMIGFMPDALPCHSDMTVDDYLDFFARAYGIRGKKRKTVVESIEEFTNLIGIKEKTINALSKGMKQRVSLARSIIHDPGVLILDEPAAGLDPRARIELRELLKALAEQGKAILVSSHILTELAEICNSAVIIESGKILRAGHLSEIFGESSLKKVLIRAACEPQILHKEVILMPKVVSARIVSKGVEVSVDGTEEDCTNIMINLITLKYKIVEFKHLDNGLEEIFLNVTEGKVG